MSERQKSALWLGVAVVAMAVVAPAVFAAADDWGFNQPVESFRRTFASVVGYAAAVFGVVLLAVDMLSSSGAQDSKQKVAGFLFIAVGAGIVMNVDTVVAKFGVAGALLS